MAIPTRHANPLNVIASERTFFVTSATWGRRRVLQSTRSAELFVRTLYEYRGQGKYRLHEFVVMPDHYQAIIAISGAKNPPRLIKPGLPLREPLRSPETRSLGNAIRQYKAGVSRWCNKAGVPFEWQTGFHDRIIFASSLEGVRQYIRANPKNWGKAQG